MVFYSCDQGLVPERRMMSMCTSSGGSPNPGALSGYLSGTCMVIVSSPDPPRKIEKGSGNTYGNAASKTNSISYTIMCECLHSR